jgi:hypothetical protein
MATYKQVDIVTESKQRGGKRDNSGRKSKYSEPTATIRLPVSMIERIKQGSFDIVTKSNETALQAENEKLKAEIVRLKRIAEIDSKDFSEVVNNLNYQLDRAKAEIQFLAQNLIDAFDLVKNECKSMKLRVKFNLHIAQAVGRALIDKRDF